MVKEKIRAGCPSSREHTIKFHAEKQARTKQRKEFHRKKQPKISLLSPVHYQLMKLSVRSHRLHGPLPV